MVDKPRKYEHKQYKKEKLLFVMGEMAYG